MITLLLALQLVSPIIGGTSDAEALIYIQTVGAEDAAPQANVNLDCSKLVPSGMYINVVQIGDIVRFVGCGDVHVYEQGPSGYNHDKGIRNFDGKEMTLDKTPILIVLPNGAKQWVKAVNSTKHATIVPEGGKYTLETPDGGIVVIEAWSPFYGTRSMVVTVTRGARVDWTFKAQL